MPQKHHPHRKELMQTRRRFAVLNLLLVAVLAVVIGYAAEKILAASEDILGEVTFQGSPAPGVGVDCGTGATSTGHATVTTGSNGWYECFVPKNSVYHVTVVSGLPDLPSGISGGATLNNPEHSGSKDYEWLVASNICYHAAVSSTCPSQSTTWDLRGDGPYYGSDLRNMFAFTEPVVRGSIVDTRTGKGIGGIGLDVCATVYAGSYSETGSNPTTGVKTKSDGTFAFFKPYGSGYCIRPQRNIPSNMTNPRTPAQNPEISTTTKSYEYQAAGKNCYHAAESGCGGPTAGTYKWDRSTDTGFTFTYTSTLPHGCGSGTLNDQCPPPPPVHGCGAGTDNSTCPKPPVHGCGAGTDNSTCSGGGGKTGGGTSGGGTSHVVDKTAPNTPANFRATLGSDKSIVLLSWSASTDSGGSGLKGYQIEKSTDKTKWTVLSASLVSPTYTDTSTAYKTAYFYRVKAIDNSGNSSGYASTSITTGEFKATANGTLISSADRIVRITLPLGALDSAASCSIVLSEDNSRSLKATKLSVVDGPYQFTCKTSDGQFIEKFKKAVDVRVYPEPGKVKKFKFIKIYTYNVDKDAWLLTPTKTDQLDNKDKNKIALGFSSLTPMILAAMGQPKAGLPWGWISFILLIILAAVAIFVIFLRRAQREHYQDYLRRKYYNL